jgi:hypothetical protein
VFVVLVPAEKASTFIDQKKSENIGSETRPAELLPYMLAIIGSPKSIDETSPVRLLSKNEKV